MADVLLEYPELVLSGDGRAYYARACATRISERSWHGWIEFEPAGDGEPVRSPRETTQPNRADALYWATGLTPVYLEGALRRALHALVPRPAPPPREPLFDAPAPDLAPAAPTVDAVLNPFSVYLKGETLLRRQLTALSPWHLVNIIRTYGIPTEQRDPNLMAASELIDAIVLSARRHAGVGIEK